VQWREPGRRSPLTQPTHPSSSRSFYLDVSREHTATATSPIGTVSPPGLQSPRQWRAGMGAASPPSSPPLPCCLRCSTRAPPPPTARTRASAPTPASRRPSPPTARRRPHPCTRNRHHRRPTTRRRRHRPGVTRRRRGATFPATRLPAPATGEVEVQAEGSAWRRRRPTPSCRGTPGTTGRCRRRPRPRRR
jgi:hypothetical protein